MKEIQKIDEKNIRGLIKKVLDLMKDMTEEVEVLEDRKGDVFERYMALHRLGAIWMGANHAMHMASHAFRVGFDLHHPFFQTREAIEKGWDSVKLDMNPFFVQEQKEAITLEMKDLPDEVKEAIVAIIKKQMDEKGGKSVH